MQKSELIDTQQSAESHQSYLEQKFNCINITGYVTSLTN